MTSGPVETTATTVWIEDGIIHIRSKGNPSTATSVTETLAVVRRLIGGTPLPVLFDARNWPSGSAEAWRIVTSTLPSVFTGVAMLVDPESPPSASVFPDTIDRMLLPYRTFTDEAEALAFLHSVEPD